MARRDQNTRDLSETKTIKEWVQLKDKGRSDKRVFSGFRSEKSEYFTISLQGRPLALIFREQLVGSLKTKLSQVVTTPR